MSLEIHKKSNEESEITLNQSNPDFEHMNSTVEFNQSLADRIDLHMCNRETSIIESNKISENDDVTTSKSSKVHKSKVDSGLFNTQATKKLFQTRIGTQSKNDQDSKSFLEYDNDLSNSETTINFQSTSSYPINIEDRLSSTRIEPETAANVGKSSKQNTKGPLWAMNNETEELSQHASQRKVQNLKFNIQTYKNQQKRRCEKLHELALKTEEKEIELIKNIKFKTKNIESKDAENELDRCMTKEDFSRMKICGQFNKGKIFS